MKNRNYIVAVLLFVVFAATSIAQPRAPLSGNITSGIRTLSADTVYDVTGFVNVFPGATLIIPAGTKLVGITGSRAAIQSLRSADTLNATNPSLGGILIAEGTRERPIVFTSSAADSAGGRGARGQIGGIIMNGVARNNVQGGTRFGEGGAAPGGGEFDNDSSGSLRYVRVEYGGTVISPGNEVNGFTWNSVGNRTKAEFLQSHFIADDAFEWFGGTADAKYLVATGCDDDQIDVEFGYRGRIQFVVVVQDRDLANRGYESNNDGSGTSRTPFTKYQAYNVTMIGSGRFQANDDINDGIYLRQNVGGIHVNNIIANFGAAGIAVQHTPTIDNLYAPESADSALAVRSSMFWNRGNTGPTQDNANGFDRFAIFIGTRANNDTAGLFPFYRPSAGNVVANPGFVRVNFSNPIDGNRPDLRPTNPATLNGATPPNDGFFDVSATYMGALRPFIADAVPALASTEDDWTTGWTNFTRSATALSVGEERQRANPIGSFELSQNYPNPFNPSTTINYRINQSGVVSLKVFDVLGREVATLVNKRQDIGSYQVNFNAAKLSSGVYFYRLQLGNVVESRKMNLVK